MARKIVFFKGVVTLCGGRLAGNIRVKTSALKWREIKHNLVLANMFLYYFFTADLSCTFLKENWLTWNSTLVSRYRISYIIEIITSTLPLVFYILSYRNLNKIIIPNYIIITLFGQVKRLKKNLCDYIKIQIFRISCIHQKDIFYSTVYYSYL